jgi:hypothetical protein
MSYTNQLSLIHLDEIDYQLQTNNYISNVKYPNDICTMIDLSLPKCSNYDKFSGNKNLEKYFNHQIKEKEVEVKLPDIKLSNQENPHRLFYKREKVVVMPLVKNVTQQKISQMSTYGRLAFVYEGGF